MNILPGEWDDIDVLMLAGVLCILAVMYFIPVSSSAGAIEVVEVTDTSILWNTTGNLYFWLDGVNISTDGIYYGQYELEPGTTHTACTAAGLCTIVKTDENQDEKAISVIVYWGIFLLLIGLCVVSYYVPITAMASLVYGIYLLQVYLPDINAGFNEYSLVGILVVISFVAAVKGWQRM